MMTAQEKAATLAMLLELAARLERESSAIDTGTLTPAMLADLGKQLYHDSRTLRDIARSIHALRVYRQTTGG